MHKVKLAAITCELPARSYENDDPVFAAVPDLSESWWQFWGVNRRGYFDPRNGENEFSLVVRAAERLLRSSDTAPDSVDMLICSASSPIMTDAGDVLPDLRGRLYPRMANVLSKQLGLSRALPLDSQMECASFLLNLRLAASMIRQGKAEKVLVVCSEYISNLLDFTSRTSTLFADGCAVALLTRGDDDSCDLLALPNTATLRSMKWPPVAGACRKTRPARPSRGCISRCSATARTRWPASFRPTCRSRCAGRWKRPAWAAMTSIISSSTSQRRSWSRPGPRASVPVLSSTN